MPHLRLRKRSYFADFYDPDRHPKRKEVPLRTRDKQAATSKMVELDRKYARGEFNPWSDRAPESAVPVTSAVERYLSFRGDRRKETQATDRVVLMKFASSLSPGALVEHVDASDVRRYVDARKKNGEPKSAATRAVYLARIKSFFTWANETGLRRANNPAIEVNPPKVSQKRPLFLTRSEYAALIHAIEATSRGRGGSKDGEAEWLANVVRVTTGTGLRVSEVCHLRWSAVDLESKLLTVQVTKDFKTKSGHERVLPLSGDALTTLQRRHEARADGSSGYVFPGTATRDDTRPYLDRGYLNKRFKHFAQIAGIGPEHTFHSLHRTYASWLVQSGVDLYVVKELLGPADIKTTMKYAFLAPSNFKAAVERRFG